MNKTIDGHLPNRLKYAIIFAFVFSVVGYLVPDAYYRYLDDTKYLTVRQPASLDQKTYEPCSPTGIVTRIESQVDLQVTSLTQLVLVRADNDFERVGDVLTDDIPIRALEDHIMRTNVELPCNIEDGIYFWQGNMNYKIRGYNKNVSFITETFTVETPKSQVQ